MRATILTVVAAVSLATTACGGDNPPPKTADDTHGASHAMATATAAAPAVTASPTPAPSDTAPVATTPPPEPPAINVVALRITPAKPGKIKSIEVSSDGAVTVDGKPAGRVTGDHVEDSNGTTLLSVSRDGSVSGNASPMAFRFGVGDELSNDDGARISVGDDGVISVQKPKGKKAETYGKIESMSSSGKREAALVVAAWMIGSNKADTSKATTAKKK